MKRALHLANQPSSLVRPFRVFCPLRVSGLVRLGLLTTFGLLVFVPLVRAQDMSFGADETGGDMSFDVEDTEEGEGEELSTDDDILGELATPDVEGETGQETGADGDGKKETPEEIYAVQQVYALRLNRLELAPSYSTTLNDPYISHPGLGMALNYWWTNVLAIGANFIWYDGLESESDLNFFSRRSTRVAIPINEYQLGAHANFTYVPLYGKFSAFNKFIFQWDTYLVGGVGVMRTRPISVIDPDIRDFDWGTRLAFNVGFGIRIFLTRWLTMFGEIRDYIFLEKFENAEVAVDPSIREDSSSWLQDGSTVVNNVTAQVGLTFFLPPRFKYKLPK